jgi:hypothetical protein
MVCRSSGSNWCSSIYIGSCGSSSTVVSNRVVLVAQVVVLLGDVRRKKQDSFTVVEFSFGF